MTVPRIRADYDQLTAVASILGREAGLVGQSLQQIRKRQEALQGGDWVGQGASAFYAEMNSQVVPSPTMNALQTVARRKGL